jgi:hypothetical protein
MPSADTLWLRNKTKYIPFDMQLRNTFGKPQVAEFKAKGIVVSSFLQKSSFARTITLDIPPHEIDRIKAFVAKSPLFNEQGHFRWSFVRSEAKFT